MFSGQHTGTTGTTQRVGHKTIGETYTFIGNPVQIGRFHVACVITAHHLRRMVIGHDIHNVVLLLFLLVSLLTGSGHSR